MALCLIGLLTFGAGEGRAASTPQSDGGVRLDHLLRADREAGQVFHQLVTANLDQCPDVRRIAEWGLHAESQYHSDLRPSLRARATVDGDLPSVAYVLPGGAADMAGIKDGDLIVSVNGHALDRGSPLGQPGYDGVERQVRAVETAIQSGRATLTLQRGNYLQDVSLIGRVACAYDLQVDPSVHLDSRADGQKVFITSGLLAFVAGDDDELAIILGHELAHNILQHHRRTLTLSVLPWRGRAAELAADRLGLALAWRAGFDVTAAPRFWRRYSRVQGRLASLDLTHPSPEARAKALDLEARRLGSSENAQRR